MEGKSEIEMVFYAEIGDPAGLEQAQEIEDHVQLETRLIDGNKLRIRHTKPVKSDKPESYIFTAKRKKVMPKEGDEPAALQESMEYSAPATKEMFDAFTEICEQVIVKRRYHFTNRPVFLTIGGIEKPIEFTGMGYEVDVFTKDGKTSAWVKVDVEMDALKAYLNEHYPEMTNYRFTVRHAKLPFKPMNVIYPAEASEEQRALVKNLWATEFTSQREAVK